MTEEASRIKRFDYDNLFKSVLKEYFWDALRIFLPALYNVADKNVPPKFLDNELKKVTFDLEGGANRSDMLAEIKLMDGGNELVLCHLEVQGEGGDDLPTRMMRYRDAIHLHYKKEPVGIAVITAQRPQDEKTFYSSDMFGVTVSYIYVNFFTAKADDEILLAGENRVGLILYAAKCAYISGKDEGKKFRYLREISDLWAAKGWNPHDKRIILEAVNYLFNLTDPMYSSQIIEYIENLSMTKEDSEMYVSVFERVYTEKGRLEGIQEGRLEGIQEGRLEGIQEGKLEGIQEGRLEGIQEGRLEGIEEGRLEGIQEGKQEIIRKMLACEMPFDTISKITGFSRDDIDGIEQRND